MYSRGIKQVHDKREYKNNQTYKTYPLYKAAPKFVDFSFIFLPLLLDNNNDDDDNDVS
jgi:hypothetical protein